ncbi:MAG: TonB-dependent receptor plug domain-containing protein [Cyclobacteriaceae bacterium]
MNRISMVRMRVFIVVLWMLPALSWAQSDTTYLKEVQISASKWQDHLVGTKIFSLDSATRSQSVGQNLGEILTQNTGIHFKSYGGSGQLSTIAFRGSGASHTAVLWNGLPVNSPNLGQVDFALFPLSGLEQISWQHGSGSAFYGSGAIGGTVIIHSDPQWGKGLRVKASQGAGSYGQHYGSVHLGHSGTRFEISTKAYYNKAVNDFKVKYQGSEYRQPNANVSSHGFQQRLSYKINQSRQMFIEGWYHLSDRRLQPLVGNFNSNDQLFDQQLRAIFHYTEAHNNGLLSFNTGYLYDFQRYNNQEGLRNHQWVTNLDYHRDLKNGLTLRIGVQWQGIQAIVPQYIQRVKEGRWAMFGALSYNLGRWHFAFNARQSSVKGFKVPFTPSFGTDLDLIKGTTSQLRAKLLLSKNYNVPSLNDRFWQPGGNIDLLPEEGIGAETSLVYEHTGKQTDFEATATYFHNHIKNWIIWIPGGTSENDRTTSFWHPENVREVKSRGVELHWQLKRSINNWKFNSRGDYAFTKTTNEKQLDRFDRSKGNQLPFVPLHRISWRLQIAKSKWAGSINLYNTGKRYIETNNESPALPAYTLVDAAVSRTFLIGTSKINVTARLNNIFNLDYTSMSLRAMPGRSYQVNVNLNLKQNKKYGTI